MKTNPLKQGALIENSNALGTVTRGMVRERAVELALINGRLPHEASHADWDQAKRELTGDPEIDPKQAVLESASESERWDPVHGSAGHQVREAPSDDEDEEGMSDSAGLVQAGINEAGHDQMLQAVKNQNEN